MRLPGVRKFFNGISRWDQETRVAPIIKLRRHRCQWHNGKSSQAFAADRQLSLTQEANFR